MVVLAEADDSADEASDAMDEAIEEAMDEADIETVVPPAAAPLAEVAEDEAAWRRCTPRGDATTALAALMARSAGALMNIVVRCVLF